MRNLSQAVPALSILAAALTPTSCANDEPGPKIIVESAGHVPPATADTQDRGLVAPITRPRVRMEPSDLSTNIDPQALALWTEFGSPVAVDLLVALARTVHLVKLSDDTEVAVSLQPIGDDARRRENLVRVEVPSMLDEGWYALSAGKLSDALEWAPGVGLSYQLSSDGIATTRFRVGSEPQVTNVFFCDASSTGASVQKVYLGLSEVVRIARPVADHVSMRTARGPVSCHSTQDDLPDQTSDTAKLTFACSDVALGDSLTITLSKAFALLSDSSQPAPGANETFTVRVGDFSGEQNPEGCGYHKLNEPL